MDQGTRILDPFKRTDKGAPKGALKEARNRGWSGRIGFKERRSPVFWVL